MDFEVASIISKTESVLIGYLVFCAVFAVAWYLVTFFSDRAYEKKIMREYRE